MVCTEMVVTVPFDDIVWMNIVDYYFDHAHWNGDERSNYESPKHWLEDKYGCIVDLGDRQVIFSSQARANWFSLAWL